MTIINWPNNHNTCQEILVIQLNIIKLYFFYLKIVLTLPIQGNQYFIVFQGNFCRNAQLTFGSSKLNRFF